LQFRTPPPDSFQSAVCAALLVPTRPATIVCVSRFIFVIVCRRLKRSATTAAAARSPAAAAAAAELLNIQDRRYHGEETPAFN
jgi:hypothetical protein